jgi:N utilization substance protein B
LKVLNAVVSEERVIHAERTRARRCALQAVYQWQMTAMDIGDIAAQFADSSEYRGVDSDYFQELLQGVVQNVSQLDAELAPALDRKIELVDPIERAVVRIATYELLFRADVPCRVILNEAVLLTRKFGAEQGYTFVNRVLDQLAHRLRSAECSRDGH